MKIADIIKYEGDNSTFIWKHPCEDFNYLTQLIVHESQEAIFFMNGQALDLFGPGRHTLETQNIPIVGKLLNRATGGESPFHCEVYFINKTVQMAIKWGTDSKVRYIDPNYGIPIEIGACGELNLAVSDSRKLLLKLVCSFISCSLALLSVKYSLAPQVDKIIIGNVMTLIPGVGLTNAIRDLFVGDVNTGILRLIDAILLGSAIAAGYVLSAFMIGGI